MKNYFQSVEEEFFRLKKLGWNLWPKNQDGIRKSQATDTSKISFPTNAWDASGENSEHTGYWAQHRAEIISQLLKKYNVKLLWEIGAGSGNATFPISQLGTPVIGIEPLDSGAANIAKLGCESFAGTFEKLEFPAQTLECVGMFDVLEHIENPNKTLAEISNSLKPSGIFIATVPAHSWLFSQFDIESGHFRRYSRKQLKLEIEASGLKVLEMSWLFGILVLPAVMLRRLPFLLGRRQNKKAQIGKIKLQGKILDRFLRAILRIESRVRPFTGLSIVVVARKEQTKF